MTNKIWEPDELVKNYPRGGNELLQPFHSFNSKDTQNWFESEGIRLKTELDGRVFPTTNDSRSIANALIHKADKLDVTVKLGHRATGFSQKANQWDIETSNGNLVTDILVITTGGSPAIWKSLASLGMAIVPPVPSLFTFHCKHELLSDLPGISFPNATAKVGGKPIQQSGPILITHEGLSGPAILKLSAWGARELHELNYNFPITINWLGLKDKQLVAAIKLEQETNPKKHVINKPVLDIPKRFWQRACELSGITVNRNYAEIGKKQIHKLIDLMLKFNIQVTGKSTNKDEFVTSGGVELSEINFTDFSVKRFSNVYLAGEVLNIDAVTGGFNFQAAWTGGYMIGSSIKV